MRKILLFALIICFFSSKSQNVDVLHYRFELQLSDKNDTIKGLATITFVRKKHDRTVELNLYAIDKKGRGMRAFPENSAHSSSSVVFSQSGDNFQLFIGSIMEDTLSISVPYVGIPADGLIISKNKYGDRTFFADNWPNRAHHWIPCVDKPDDKASFEFIVTAPSHYKVISNGIKLAEKEVGNEMKLTHWREDSPLSTKMMVIGVAKFATKTYDDSPKDIPISAWAYPRDSAKWFYDYALTPGILKFFADYIGPFPYNKLANVQSKTAFGGMENASAIFYNEDYVTGSRTYEDVMAHEIAHQWFGDMVSEKSFAHLWLSEGFADFFESLYTEKKYGEKAAREKWIAARDEVIAFARQSNKAVVDSTEDLMSLLNANSYKKGAWVLRMLQNEVGDSVFKKIIQTYYNQYKGSNAETRDFEAVAEKVSGKELTWFFDQWLYQPGIPKLNVTWDYNREDILFSPFGFEKKYKYQLPLEILLIFKDGTTEKQLLKIEISEKAGTYVIPSKKKPSKILLDPNAKLLFEGSISQHQ